MSGEELIIACEVTGVPQPEVKWYKDHTLIDFYRQEQKYVKKELGSLYIPKVTIEEAAHYLCTGENPAGIVKQEIHLIVLGIVN